MLSFGSSQRYFLYRGATDMRKSFNGLSGLVRQYLSHPLLSGDVFIFINRRKDRIKLLMWDQTGFALYYKRLEQGTFELPQAGQEQASIELSRSELLLVLEGIELSSVRRRKRYHRA